jgi:DNA-binding transcriptional MocR family regulator
MHEDDLVRRAEERKAEAMGKVLRKGEKLTSEWEIIDVTGVSRQGVVLRLEHLEANYQTRDGFEHFGGAHRVTVVNVETGKNYARPQTFYGETAWSDANRAFNDAYFENLQW